MTYITSDLLCNTTGGPLKNVNKDIKGTFNNRRHRVREKAFVLTKNGKFNFPANDTYSRLVMGVVGYVDLNCPQCTEGGFKGVWRNGRVIAEKNKNAGA